METGSNNPHGRLGTLKQYPVAIFFVLAYLIGLGVLTLVHFFNMPQLVLIAASSSSIAGIITAALYGKTALKSLFASLVKFKCGASSYMFALIVPTVITIAAVSINALFGNSYQVPAAEKWVMIIPALLFMTTQAGLGEELGWRGFALPMLLRSKSVLASSLIIGVVWAFWHTPLYFLKGMTQHDLAQQIGFLPTFVAYGIFVVSASVVFSWIYIRSGRSLIPPILMHGISNLWGWFFAYKDINASIEMMIMSFILWALLAVFIALKSPFFRASGLHRPTASNH